ncbi:MAG: MFS transporter [Rudaea sp.]
MIESQSPGPRNSIFSVLGIGNFRLLWIGQGTSLLGDYFHFIALPWLVLQITNNDAFALAVVLALAGIPRALFLLVGGAITDRISSRTVMLASDIIRLFLSAILMVLVLFGMANLWALCAIALVFGLVGGFFQPAAGSILPSLVRESQLQAANSLYQGSIQLLAFVGPMLAGAVIALFGSQSAGLGAPGSLGIAIAFALDALSFLISVFTLSLMRVPQASRPPHEHREPILTSIRGGISFALHDSLLFWMLIVITAANLLFAGPVSVGIPVVAKARLPEGVAAFGIIMAGYGGGNLLGTILSGIIHARRGFAPFTVALLFGFGLGLALFGWISSTWIGFLILLILGIGNGYLSIILITMLQRRTPREMMGRIMSLVLLSNLGLAPISQALAGAILNYSAVALFVGAGGLMALVALWTALSPTARILDAEVGRMMSETETAGAAFAEAE